MENKREVYFQVSVFTVLIVLGLFLVGCGELETITVGKKTYTFNKTTEQKDQDKAEETSKELNNVKIEPTNQEDQSNPAQPSSESDKVRNELVSGLETAISAMQNWDNLPPEKRQSIINSLKDLAAQNR